ncbi:MAG: hypothetical protein KA974_04405 [Saprospiraceae bacterium]|nr:hypothetical protein [Saprospiraceae bacterium]MBP7679519.1 hypothetical protein [Saprospiraceae bacterium]
MSTLSRPCRILPVLLLLVGVLYDAPAQLRFRAASALSSIALYPDSTFTKPATASVREGELLEVLAESRSEHEDSSQDQRFRWYQVRTIKGDVGWVFGDGVAVMLPDAQKIEPAIQLLNKQNLRFDNGFEQTFSWVAAVDGHDNGSEKEWLNPAYHEQYIVLTNTQKRSVHIPIAGESVKGKFMPANIWLHDVTGDSIAEIIIEQRNIADTNAEERSLEVYGFQGGTLVKIFEEPLSLPAAGMSPLPAPYKMVELIDKNVRVAYIGFRKHETVPQEWCMEYVTYSYLWNKLKKKFNILYKESRTLPTAEVATQAALRSSVVGSMMAYLPKGEKVKVLRQANHGKDVAFYVATLSGMNGYISAKDLQFVDMDYANLLNKFYHNNEIPTDNKLVRLKQ